MRKHAGTFLAAGLHLFFTGEDGQNLREQRIMRRKPCRKIIARQ
jgi:hypothetical protein